MQQSLVLLVPRAELLQEQMSVPDDLLHLHIILQTDDIEMTYWSRCDKTVTALHATRYLFMDFPRLGKVGEASPDQ